MHLPAYVYHVSLRRYRPLKVPLSCEVIEKRWVLGPPICRGRDAPELGHAFSNSTDFQACGRFWLSSIQGARKVGGEKKEEESR